MNELFIKNRAALDAVRFNRHSSSAGPGCLNDRCWSGRARSKFHNQRVRDGGQADQRAVRVDLCEVVLLDLDRVMKVLRGFLLGGVCVFLSVVFLIGFPGLPGMVGALACWCCLAGGGRGVQLSRNGF